MAAQSGPVAEPATIAPQAAPAANLTPTTTSSARSGRMAQVVDLPEQFVISDDLDEASPLTEGTEPVEPLGDDEGEAPEEEGTDDPAAKATFSVDEWADLIAAPGARQRIAEAPAAQRGAIVDALLAKEATKAKALADTVARDALQRGIEEGRNALARELVVQNIDKMEPFEREELFRQQPDAERLWHESKVQRTQQPAAASNAFVDQIIQQGQAQLQRLDGHPEYGTVADEMTKGIYAADPAGLARLAARVERALAVNQASRDDADAAATNRAAAVLKSAPRTRAMGSGAAAAGPLTAERAMSMTQEQLLDFMNRVPDGEKQIAKVLQDHARSFA